MDDHEAQAAPPTVRLFLAPGDRAGSLIAAATEHPPRGSLDGWRAVDVDEEAWHEFDRARRELERAKRTLTASQERHERALARLDEEVRRG